MLSHLHPPITPTKPSKTLPPSSPQPQNQNPGLLFRQKLIYLQTLKVNPTKALSKNPLFRSSPLSLLKSVESCLRSMGIDKPSLGRILDMYPQLLTSDPYYDLYPVLDFLLNDVFIPFQDVRKCIVRCPRLLVSDVDSQLRPALRFLRDLGFVGKYGIDCQTTVLLVSNVDGTLLPKVNYLRGLGFSCDEVKNMVLRSPGLLTFSIPNNYEPKVEYFLKEMNRDLGELKRFPQYFSFSLEGRIKPRHQVLVENGIWLTLPEMLKVSDGEFNVRLIERRLQLADRGWSKYASSKGEILTGSWVFVQRGQKDGVEVPCCLRFL